MSRAHAFLCIAIHFLNLHVFCLLFLSLTLKSILSWQPRNTFLNVIPSPITLIVLLLFLLLYDSNDSKYQNEFEENISLQSIHTEHQFILFDLSDTMAPETFRSHGCKFLCGQPITYPSVFIQEFYSNIYTFNAIVPQITTRVHGTCIIVTP